MGMILGLTTVSDTNIALILKHPPLVNALLRNLIADAAAKRLGVVITLG